jgi:8-oxo-dGTP pyrophosphatase MutT (NUDIX family)
MECARRETYEETGLDLNNYQVVSHQRLSVGEYYFFEIGDEVEPEIQDVNEVCEARWMSLAEIRSESCNVDVNNVLSRMRRQMFRDHPRI